MFPHAIFHANNLFKVIWFLAHIKCACNWAQVKVCIGVKRCRMNSMTSYENEDMVGKMSGCKEDSDEFDDIMWKRRYGKEKCMDTKKILVNSVDCASCEKFTADLSLNRSISSASPHQTWLLLSLKRSSTMEVDIFHTCWPYTIKKSNMPINPIWYRFLSKAHQVNSPPIFLSMSILPTHPMKLLAAYHFNNSWIGKSNVLHQHNAAQMTSQIYQDSRWMTHRYCRSIVQTIFCWWGWINFITLDSQPFRLLQMVPHTKTLYFSWSSTNNDRVEYLLSMYNSIIPSGSLATPLETLKSTTAFCVVGNNHASSAMKALVAFLPWYTSMW